MNKMKNIAFFLIVTLFVFSQITCAQVGIGTINPDSSSILDLSTNSQGLLVPRMTTVQRDAIRSPAVGLLIYNTTTSIFNFYNVGWKDFLTGFILPVNGGTGIINNNDSTLTLTGAYPTTITTSGITEVTLPTTGILYGTEAESMTSAQILNSLTDETGSGSSVFSTSPTFVGVPTAPTAANGTNTSQVATTAFVLANNPNRYSSINGSSSISTTSTTDIVADGMTLTPGAGIYVVTFNSQYTIDSVDKTQQSVIDLNTAYDVLIAKAATNTSHASVFGNGETLTAGVYTIAGAGTAAGTLTLDAAGDPNAVFIFRIGGAFSTTAGTTVILKNGASSCNVFWVVEGAIGIGTSTTMKGMLLAHSGAVALGASSNLEGRLFTNLGAIGVDNSIISIPTSCSYLDLGILSSFAIFSSNGDIGNTGHSYITGDTAAIAGAVTGFQSATVNGTINFSGIIYNSTASFSVYQNGVLIADSIRTRMFNLNIVDISLQAIANVIAGQAIDIRWKINMGTVTLKNRILTLIKVQ
ncbi:ice-binding family protein [Flavobacterium sp. LB1P62]|uniref:ice-binding family protein n=1 Tax=Flavobacterium sp. LB1P62 TaxID=3401715 RepID=UPI003AAEF53E